MTNEREERTDIDAAAGDDAELERDPMRGLLKRAIRGAPRGSQASKSILPGVQRRLRVRSRGKFYANGWAISQGRMRYALIAALMLLIIGVALVALGPMGISR